MLENHEKGFVAKFKPHRSDGDGWFWRVSNLELHFPSMSAPWESRILRVTMILFRTPLRSDVALLSVKGNMNRWLRTAAIMSSDTDEVGRSIATTRRDEWTLTGAGNNRILQRLSIKMPLPKGFDPRKFLFSYLGDSGIRVKEVVAPVLLNGEPIGQRIEKITKGPILTA